MGSAIPHRATDRIRVHRAVLVTSRMLRQEVTRALGWLAVQADRVWRLLPDVWRLVTGSARTVRWLVAPARAWPGIAFLEGEAFVRPGTPSAYRMRVHNPRNTPESLRVLIRGWCDRGGVPPFTITWHTTLDAHGSAEQWVRTSWCGDATMLDGPPRDATLPWTASDPQGRWMVEACVARGRARDWLRIGGTLVR
jgi:hypothetical protein